MAPAPTDCREAFEMFGNGLGDEVERYIKNWLNSVSSARTWADATSKIRQLEQWTGEQSLSEMGPDWTKERRDAKRARDTRRDARRVTRKTQGMERRLRKLCKSRIGDAACLRQRDCHKGPMLSARARVAFEAAVDEQYLNCVF